MVNIRPCLSAMSGRFRGRHVEDLRMDHLAAAEGQQLLRQIARAFAGLRDDVEVGKPAAVWRQVLTRQLRKAEDRLQQVVEIVRDAARQLADRLQLAALRFRFPGGHVPPPPAAAR
jgi:hypothetical protein